MSGKWSNYQTSLSSPSSKAIGGRCRQLWQEEKIKRRKRRKREEEREWLNRVRPKAQDGPGNNWEPATWLDLVCEALEGKSWWDLPTAWDLPPSPWPPLVRPPPADNIVFLLRLLPMVMTTVGHHHLNLEAMAQWAIRNEYLATCKFDDVGKCGKINHSHLKRPLSLETPTQGSCTGEGYKSLWLVQNLLRPLHFPSSSKFAVKIWSFLCPPASHWSVLFEGDLRQKLCQRPPSIAWQLQLLGSEVQSLNFLALNQKYTPNFPNPI